MRATVCWYATGLHDGKLGADKTDSLERAGDIDGEILLIFGTSDPHTPQPGRETIRARARSGTRFIWSEYDAEHAFGRDIGHRFDPEATDRAFAETVAFFRRTPVILYDHPASANCLKVRILLRQLGLAFERVTSISSAARRSGPEHLARNPDGRVPVLELDSGELIPESGAILLYLAEGTPFLPPPGSSARACTSGCSSSRTRSRRMRRSRASWR